MALGVDESCSYLSGSQAALKTGDIVVIGTDGIWETQNERSEKFGKERLSAIVQRLAVKMRKRSCKPSSAPWRISVVNRAQEDDITLVIVKARIGILTKG